MDSRGVSDPCVSALGRSRWASIWGQTLDRAVDRYSPAVPIVRLTDGRVEWLVMNVEDLCSSGRSEFDRSHEPPDSKRLDKVVNLLPVRDARERCVLTSDENAGVDHHCSKKASLTCSQTEGCEGARGLRCCAPYLQRIRPQWHSKQ